MASKYVFLILLIFLVLYAAFFVRNYWTCLAWHQRGTVELEIHPENFKYGYKELHGKVNSPNSTHKTLEETISQLSEMAMGNKCY